MTSPATLVSVQRALDSNFTLGLVSAQVAPAQSYVDNTVQPLTTYYYRYLYSNPAGVSAGPSSSVTTPAYIPPPATGTTMADNYIGANSLLGIGTEAVEGHPVQVQNLLDYTGGTITPDLKVLYSKVLRGTAAGKVKRAAGRATYAGDITLDVTPEGMSKALASVFGPPVTVAGTGAAVGTFTHTFSNTFAQTPVTLVQKIGATIKVWPGCRGSSFKIGVDKEQDSVINATVGYMALNELIYAADGDVGLTGAGYDPLQPFSPVDATLSIAGAASTSAKTFEVTCNRNLGERNVLNGYRGATGHYSQVTDVSATASLYFVDESAMKVYFGQADAVVAPYGATKTVFTQTVTLRIMQSANYELDVVFPACTYEKLGQPVSGPDVIMQEVSLTPVYDPATGTDMQIVLRNTQANTVITTAGSPISAVPANAVNPFVSP